MSYILDALKKNKSKEDGEVPNLSSDHSDYNVNDLEEENSAGRWIWPIVVMVLLLTIAVLSFMLLNPSALQVSQQLVQSSVGVESTAEMNNTESLVEPNKPPLGSEETVITNKPLSVGKPVVQKKPMNALPVKEVVKKPSNSALAESQSKTITKADLPSIIYTTHIYATQPSDRFVMLNGRAYAEGDTTAEGLVIKEILENDLVVTFKGQEFVLPSLEDVNAN